MKAKLRGKMASDVAMWFILIFAISTIAGTLLLF
jgi:hypothetical protein